MNRIHGDRMVKAFDSASQAQAHSPHPTQDSSSTCGTLFFMVMAFTQGGQ
jgi:hypothetical protein